MSAQPVRLTGRAGEVASRLTFDNAFTVRLIPTQPLELDDQFSIVIDRQVRDAKASSTDRKRHSTPGLHLGKS